MVEDARFEDGAEQPLRLMAADTDDLAVIAGLTQDAVLLASEMTYRRKERRLALLLNRFRWEDAPRAEARKRPVERVQSMLVVEDALAVRTQGITPGDKDTVLSLLTVAFEPGEDGTGKLRLTFAGDGGIEADVEALNVQLKDVTRPYVAPSGHTPQHETP